MITYGSTTLTSYNTITKIEVYYYKSTSATSLSGGSWSTTKPTWENGKYIWQKIRTTYEGKLENGQYYSESDPVNITGQQGQQGETGASAYSYKLNASDTIISVSKNGTYSTNSVTFSATSKQGNENVNPYKGRFKIETTTDGITWTTQYTSSTNESSKTFTIPENITNIRCSLYQADGTTVLLDITSVSIVRDGTDATGLKDSIPFYLASDKETDITIYDEGWSTIRPALDATNKYLWVYYLSRYSNGTTDPELIEVFGDIATFENNGDISPIYSTEVDIEPIQDLNGFDHAWNGGDGKNLLVYPYYTGDTYTSHGLTFTVEKYPNGAIKDVLVNGTSDASTFFNFSAWANSSSAKTDMSKYCGQSMILSGGTSDARIVMQYRNPNSTSNIYLVNDTGGSGVTFTVPDASDLGTWAIFISISSGLTFNNVRVYPMLRFASETDGTYEPYENICPIEGWNSVKIERTGKNLLGIKYPNRTNNGVTFTVNGSEITVNGTATADAWSSTNLGSITSNLQYKNLIPPGQYMLTGGKSTDKRIYLTGNYLDGKAITIVNDYGNGALYTFTDWAYVYPQIRINNGVTVENEVFNIQLEATTTATEYESYNGNTYEIDFPTEAGTIFKGKLIIDENGDGQLIQTHELKTLVGNDIAGVATAENVTRFYTNASYTNCEIVSCDSYKINDNATTTLNRIGKMSGDTRIFGTPTWLQGVATKAEAQTLLNANPINIVLELAEPIIYTFTAKQILALLKTNHIYANTGNTTVKYYDNQKVTEPYIDYSATSAFEYSAEALEKIDNLEIGGRNLLRMSSMSSQDASILNSDTNFTKYFRRYNGNASQHTFEKIADGVYQDTVALNTSGNLGVAFGRLVSEFNFDYTSEYTLSCWAKCTKENAHLDIGLSYYKNNDTWVWRGGTNPQDFKEINKWQFFKLTFKPDTDTKAICYCFTVKGETNGTDSFIIRNCKLEKGNKPTDWTPAPEDVEEEVSTLRTDLQSQIDEKIQTFYQSTNPASSWTTTELRTPHDGDLWYYTGTTTSTYTKDNVYRYNASNNTWSVYSASGELFDKVDGKSTIFYGTTSGTYIGVETGDYLVDSTDGSSYRWDGSKWVKVTDYKTTITNAIDDIEIGGRNLLKGTATGEGWTYTSFDSNTKTFTRSNSTLSEKYIQSGWATEPLQSGQEYTISCWMKTNGYVSSVDVFIVDKNVKTSRSKSYPKTSLSTEWQYYKTVLKTIDPLPSGVDLNNWYVRFDNNATTENGTEAILYVKDIKLEKGNKATDWTPAPEDTTASIQAYVDTLQFQVDHMAEIYYGTAVPTLSNTPASSWNTNDIKDIHVDDLYYNTSTGYCYRFTKSGSTYSWTRIKDSDITAAATAASNANTAAGNAQTTANNANTLAGQKRRIFVAQPTPPYEVGDLWVEGSNGDIKKCKTARATGSYTAGDWELASKYTDDTKANTANTKVDNLKKVRLGWKVNYSDYSTPNNGECIFHGYDSNNAVAHVDGIVEWNGADLTITKGMWINPNKVTPYNTPVLHVYRTSVAPHHADVWWDDTQKKWRGYMYKDNHTPDVTSDATSAAGEWIWDEVTDCILATYVSSGSEGAITSAQLFNPPKKFSELPDPSLAQNLVDNLEIGSRNLLKGTASPNFVTTSAVYDSNWRGMSGGNGAFSIAEIDDSPVLNVNKSFRIMNNTTGNRDFVQWVKDFNINWGGKWIFSCYARGIGDSVRALIRSWNNTDSNAALTYYQTIPEATWTKIIVKIPEDMQWSSSADSTDKLDFRFGITGAGSIEYIAPKLERGNKATDWSPAPEDTQADIDIALAQSVEYIVGTQTASTGTWTGTTTDNELKVGKTIAYKLPYAGSGNASLVLTLANGSTTDAIPVYLNTTRVTTHFGANSVINMTYDGQYWRASSIPNTNTYDRRQHSGAITAKTAVTAGHLIVGNSTGYQQITSTSGGTLEFDLGYPILWAYSKIDATKTSNATYEAYPSVNFSTSGTIQNGAANKMLWLKGTIRGNIFTLASANFLTTQIPTSDDGMYYIPLGIMSSVTEGYFSSSNRIYAYIDEDFQPLDNAAALTAIKARSEIVQTQQTLSLQIRDISVGGANLFERTKTFEGTANQSTAHDSFTEFVYKDLTVKSANTVTFGNKVVELSAYQYTDLTSNMWYSFSFYAKGNVDIGFMYAGTGNAVIDSIDVSWDDNTYTGFNTTSTSSNIIWLTPTNNWQRYSVVFHIEEQDITALHRLIGLYARPVSSYTELSTENKNILITETGTDVHLIMEGNEIQICGYKLELGNKPTDWTPADNDKATYDNIISQINLSKEGIAIRADKIRLEGMITANEGFSIDEYGNMTANNGTFNGIFESYATEINENTFDLSINNGHIQFYNNNRTLTEDERYVGYMGGIRKNTSFIDGSIKNNDAITIGLYNNSDFLINAYDDTTPTPICEVMNYVTGKPTFNFWVPARIYDGNKLQMYSRNESHGSQIEFRRYSSNTGGYVSRGSLSLHSIQDNSDISDRLYLLSKNQGNDLAGDQFLYFAGKGLRYSSSGQPMRTGYVATDKYIVTQDFSLSNQTIAKNTSQNFTIDISRDGYTPIMCVPKVGGGSGAYHLSIYSWGISGNIATIYTHNNSSSYDVSDVTIRVQVLYKLTY